MPADRDLETLLPEAPPPRPTRREEAIEAALQRFDGAPPANAPHTPRPAWSRPQFGVLVAASLVAVIAVPVWLIGDERGITEPAPRRMTDIDIDQEAAPTPALAVPTPLAAPAEGQTSRKAPEPLAKTESPAKPQPQADVAQASASATEEMVMAPPAPAPPPPPAAIVLTGRATSAPAEEAKAAAEDGARDMVVTAQRRSGFSERRERSRAKRAEAAPAAGMAPAPDDEIAALDRAIAAAPRSAEAWYKRGLAYQRRGDEARARADFERAAALDPRYER